MLIRTAFHAWKLFSTCRKGLTTLTGLSLVFYGDHIIRVKRGERPLYGYVYGYTSSAANGLDTRWIKVVVYAINCVFPESWSHSKLLVKRKPKSHHAVLLLISLDYSSFSLLHRYHRSRPSLSIMEIGTFWPTRSIFTGSVIERSSLTTILVAVPRCHSRHSRHDCWTTVPSTLLIN